ncbi:unnamed protein product [Angiostrongylus costaricensis]|uniref:Uncharacterized protein n=1 Tax=Angiostrongylus costaricensis TaxID=334426 RepID=A0A0R3Q231_ANGCS|nr:unnamed protein product [Angiostrongylus costaricensis]
MLVESKSSCNLEDSQSKAFTRGLKQSVGAGSNYGRRFLIDGITNHRAIPSPRYTAKCQQALAAFFIEKIGKNAASADNTLSHQHTISMCLCLSSASLGYDLVISVNIFMG